MRNRGRLALVAAGVVSLGTSACWTQTSPAQLLDPRIAAARAISQKFGTELRAALEKALTDKGPAAAIGVCRDEAPRIAARLSAESGAAVARTSLRVRNPRNAPQPWQRADLEAFEKRLASGSKPDELEHFEARPNGGARYMKAIITQPLCLACHGEAIAPDVARALEADYPRDKATGFKVGDLRGAFSIEWPAGK